MSEYHNQQAFDDRLAHRQALLVSPLPLKVFYHISCMNNWKKVVEEQLRLLAFVGLYEARSFILGSVEDSLWIVSKAHELGVSLTAVSDPNIGLYELPTLQILYESTTLKGYPDHNGAVLYFHTKGVSAPDDRNKIAWRRLMQKHVIANWKENLQKLAVADILGVSWQELRDFPHFQGNFWMARADWISHLQSPSEYRKRHGRFDWGGHSWNDRMFVETWLGSEAYHHVESLVCRNGCFWQGGQIFSYDLSIPGFDYED